MGETCHPTGDEQEMENEQNHEELGETFEQINESYFVRDHSKELIEKLEKCAEQISEHANTDSIAHWISSFIGSKPYVMISDEDGLKVVYPSFLKIEEK